jgi:glycosyltransferase involved in cell wall biosynthesis
MAALKIGYLAERLSSGTGTDRYSRSLSEAVSDCVSVRVLTMRGAHNDTTLADVRAVLPAPRFHPVAQVRVAWHVFRHLRGCDAIHSLVEHYGPGLALAGHFLGIPVTMTLHGTYAVPPATPSLKRWMMRYMYRRMPIVTSGSVYTEKKVRDVAPLGVCEIIPNGVNLERFRVLGGVEKEELVLTVGALKARKGVDIVLHALKHLAVSHPKLQYAVVGDDAHDGFSHTVQRLVRELGLEKRVTFYEHISDETLVELYNRAKVFVLAARETSDGAFEGFPMVYYEANGCGTPVVTTTGFGSEYAIHDGENGLLVPPENPEAVAQALEHLFANKERYEHMREKALAAAQAHTWGNIAHILEAFYHRVISATT